MGRVVLTSAAFQGGFKLRSDVWPDYRGQGATATRQHNWLGVSVAHQRSELRLDELLLLEALYISSRFSEQTRKAFLQAK